MPRVNIQQIDHSCLLVSDIGETKAYLESLFDLETRFKPGDENTLMCENDRVHFFVKQVDFPTRFLREQHLSFTVSSLESVEQKLKKQGIDYERGTFNEFQHHNYDWIEWRDSNGIRFECIEKT